MSIQIPMKIFREYDHGPLELHIARFTWDRGNVGDGVGYSSKLSFKLQFVPRDLWVGVFWKLLSPTGVQGWVAYICILPCLPLRIKLIRSFGGRFP